MSKPYRVFLTAEAEKMLSAISDRRIQRLVLEKIRHLDHEPGKQGKPLLGELAGFRSARAAGQRLRIIYKIDEEKDLIIIATVGLRKQKDRADIYALAKKLIKLKLL
jgi:mRNA interferase RelE/StbE